MSSADLPPIERTTVPLGEPSRDPAEAVPAVVGGCELLECIGEASGQGTVYRARQVSCGREVAVKLLRPGAGSDEVLRFLREARVTAMLDEHPHVVRVYEAGRCADGRPYLVMELLSGPTVSGLLRRAGRLSIGAACEVVRQAAQGLHHAHEKEMVHRDVKPGNLMFAASGVVKVLDFGLARPSAGEPTFGLTCTGTTMGTPHYMAPEQVESAKSVDRLADLYSLGCVLYQLLTGRLPFGSGRTSNALIMAAHLQDPVPDVRAACPEVDPELAGLLAGLLARDRAERKPQTGAALAQALRRWADAAALAAELEQGGPATARGEGTAIDEKAQVATTREVVGAAGLRLVRIPAGTFLMGSPDGEAERNSDEGPQHAVTISRAYWMGAFPVTVGQFRAFVEATGYRTEAERTGGASGWTGTRWERAVRFSWRAPGFEQGDDHPVTCVTWEDAVAFTGWLSSQRAGPVVGAYRLPTEAEWEYACRGGPSPYQVFHVGDSLGPAQANIDGAHPYGGAPTGENRERTTPVGAFAANGLGLYDMHGNVWEWCQDWYDRDYYRISPRVDPPGPARCMARVVRGGSWHGHGAHCRSAQRFRFEPERRYGHLGFRVVLADEGPSQ